MSDYFQLMSADGDRTVTRGNPFKLSVNYFRTNTRKKLFSERVAKVWNSLPPSIVKFQLGQHTVSLVVPPSRRTTLGDRAFPVAAARAWNDLPPTIRGPFYKISYDLS